MTLPPLLARVDGLRRKVAHQGAACRDLRRESKAVRAAASATGDAAAAVLLHAKGVAVSPVPPVPAHVPGDWS